MDREAWHAVIHGVAKIQTQLNNWTELNWKSLQMVTAAMKLKDTCSLEERVRQRHYFANKGSSSQGYGFSSSHVWMWELNSKGSWVPKNWCFWTVVLEKTLESPFDSKEIQPVHPKGKQSQIFTGRTDAEAETPLLWPPDAGKDWRWEKGMIEDEMVGCHHWPIGHEFK